MRTRLSRIIAFRLVVSSLLLTSAMAIGISAPDTFPVNPFVFLIGVTYAVSGLYLATLRLAERWPAIVDLQFAADAVLVSAFIHLTGGVTSQFSTLYILPIIAASTVRARPGAVQVAALSATLYTGIVFAQYLDVGVIPEGWWRPAAAALPSAGFAEYTVAINLAGMFGVALLSGSLAERLRSARAGLEDASFEIADLRAFNDHLIDCLASGVITTDGGGRVLTFNRAAARITGMSQEEARNREVREVLQLPEDVAASLARLETGKSRRVEILFRSRDGRAIELGLSAATLQFPEGSSGFLITFQDVTDLKRLERDGRLQQRLAAVGEMAAGIAHELRNPLAAMSGSIEVLRQELPLTDEQRQLMDIALRESERLNERIRLFLAYARPQRFALTRVDIRRVLHDSAQLLRSSVDIRDNHVIEVEAGGGPIVHDCDEAEIRQILWSLGTNGLRSMPNGGRLRMHAALEDGADTLVLAVQDEGCGIPSEELETVFQPFRRSFEQGTGLGLAIVHRIATDYGGRVDVTSTVGAGTTVHVRLPRHTAADLAAPPRLAAGRTA